MSVALKLPARLDSAAAGPLAEELRGLKNQPVTLDASDVTGGGALGLQVLVSACRQWRADAQPFQVTDISDGLSETCRLLGIAPAEIGATEIPGGLQ